MVREQKRRGKNGARAKRAREAGGGGEGRERFLPAPPPSRGPIFRSARTGTLALMSLI